MSTNPTWKFEIDGNDLVVRNITATCFGGKYDLGDNGQTESGVLNHSGFEDTRQCALPIRSVEHATANSPLAFKGPHIPWKTVVKVWREADGEATAIDTVLTDNGPDTSRFPTHALDLNPAAAHCFSSLSEKAISNGFMESGMSYRIVGGAKFVS